MDPIVSASVYVALTLILRGISGLTRGYEAILLMVLVVLNSVQFAFFTGLWPFYIFAAVDGIVSIFIVVRAYQMAKEDARNA